MKTVFQHHISVYSLNQKKLVNVFVPVVCSDFAFLYVTLTACKRNDMEGERTDDPADAGK